MVAQSCYNRTIKECAALITDMRHLILEVQDFKNLKDLLKKKKIKGLALKTRWFEIGAEKVRLVVYPKGNKTISIVLFPMKIWRMHVII